eukprot:COSAG05_NODE_1659_length_4322_cov_1019.871892_2_plen_118_part_00
MIRQHHANFFLAAAGEADVIAFNNFTHNSGGLAASCETAMKAAEVPPAEWNSILRSLLVDGMLPHLLRQLTHFHSSPPLIAAGKLEVHLQSVARKENPCAGQAQSLHELAGHVEEEV